jgi:hypothetical protein
VCDPPERLFDLVFLDEAHHAPAKTWAAILRAMRSARCVLLTATPFRNDKRRLGARLIYHYPISRALADGIYRPVSYHPVSAPPNRAARDAELCAAAKKIVDAEKEAGNAPRILARAADVAWANGLVATYEKHGLRMAAVDYDKSASENKATIDAVRAGTLDGMLCVGMLGEGIDLPALKIAVLHSAPRSLPFTLQFIGRVSRTDGTSPGEAHLLSVPEEVKGEMRRLHRNDADWRDLVPKLAEEVLGRSGDLRHFRSGYSLDDLDIDPAQLKPFFSVRVFNTTRTKLRASTANLEAPESAELCLNDYGVIPNSVLVVTEREAAPSWAMDTALLQPTYDLHIFALRGAFLFESTTWETGADQLRRQLFHGRESLVGGAMLSRALHGIGSPTYFNIGLRNATGSNSVQAAYKTLAGSQVEAAVRPTEGQTYAPGHALARIWSGETRGIATANGRVWAIKRADVHQFGIWCETVAASLTKVPKTSGLPQLGFLASATQVSKLNQTPLGAYIDEETLRARITVTVRVAGATQAADLLPYIDVGRLSSGKLACTFEYHSALQGIKIEYDPASAQCWNQLSGEDTAVQLEFPNGSTFSGDLTAYLSEYPPRLLMPSGGTIIGRDQWLPSFSRGPLPGSVLVAEVWDDCDILHEVGDANSDFLNVQDWLETILLATVSDDAIVVKDHGKGELADFIVIEPGLGNREITFFHCKAAGKGKRLSDRVKDVEEVLSQACRSAQWIGRPSLLAMIEQRTKPTRNSPLVWGTENGLAALVKSFETNAWTYRIVAVQPGVECAQIQTSDKIGFLVVTAYELISRTNATFSFWGS